jgi:hypothetical protein
MPFINREKAKAWLSDPIKVDVLAEEALNWISATGRIISWAKGDGWRWPRFMFEFAIAAKPSMLPDAEMFAIHEELVSVCLARGPLVLGNGKPYASAHEAAWCISMALSDCESDPDLIRRHIMDSDELRKLTDDELLKLEVLIKFEREELLERCEVSGAGSPARQARIDLDDIERSILEVMAADPHSPLQAEELLCRLGGIVEGLKTLRKRTDQLQERGLIGKREHRQGFFITPSGQELWESVSGKSAPLTKANVNLRNRHREEPDHSMTT